MNSLLKVFRSIQTTFLNSSNNIIKNQTPVLNARLDLMEYNGNDWKKYLPSESELKCKMKETNLTYGKFTLEDFSNDTFEIILIVWLPNSITQIHNHPIKGCCLKMLEGELTETTYYSNNLEKSNEILIKPPCVSYIDNKWFYNKIENRSNKFAYSLHLYSPPNFTSKTFTEKI